MDAERSRWIPSAIVVAAMGVLLMFGIIVGCASSCLADRPGAQLWGENCGRCHNVRSPASYTDDEWSVVVMHMRTRANLTADEAGKITDFMKAAN